MTSVIRVLIVEDSVTQREIFRRLFNEDSQFTVVAEAATGHEAIAMVQKHLPDVVLMDIHMPDMDGISATREIMRRFPVPIVVASSTLRKYEVDLAMTAFEAGAVSVIEKPQGAVLLNLHRIAPLLRDELIAATKAKLRLPLRSVARRPGRSAVPSNAGRSAKVVGVCASTGGPPVLLEILSGIPRPYPLPILLVQHISRGFEEGFARWLADATGQAVGIAADGQRLAPGVWMCEGGRHLTLAEGSRIALPIGAADDLHVPSGNPLFESLAKSAGSAAVGILLTGMGDDGATGLLTLKRAGGVTMIQNESSCLIWGMPKAGREIGAALHELSPTDISSSLTGLTQSHR